MDRLDEATKAYLEWKEKSDGSDEWHFVKGIEHRRNLQTQATGFYGGYLTTLRTLLATLGWSGGTVEQVVAEVERLKSIAVLAGLASSMLDTYGNDCYNDAALSLSRTIDKLRVGVSRAPLGQGVAALLPEHGEVKHGQG